MASPIARRVSRWVPCSLQGRITALVLCVVGGVWLLTAVLTWRDVRHELDELLDSHLAQAAAVLVVQQTGHDEADDSHHDAPQLHRYSARVAFQVWHEGQLIQRSANAPTAPMVPGLDGAPDTLGFHTVDIGGAPWRVFTAHGSERDVRVAVGEQLATRHDILWAVLRSVLTPMALSLPLLALAAWWAVRRGTQPLRSLGQTLAARGPRTLEPVTLHHAPAEMQPLLAALNGLFERIHTMVESETRFTADAAHELRTPIAAIRTQAQVALGAQADDERRHALQATVQGCDRATRLVEQLLTLARLESAPAAAEQTTDLVATARRLLADLAPQALQRDQALELIAPAHCPVSADESLLGVLLRNLLDNAQRYSPAGAQILVTVSCDPVGHTGPLLQVEDSGPGLSAEDGARLGERFFRVLGTEPSGSGLGWSIVRRIAAVQGAEVVVLPSARLGGLCVQVRWPRAAAG